jgi:hypothetical protein
MLNQVNIEYTKLALVIISGLTLIFTLFKSSISKIMAHRRKIRNYKQVIRVGTVYDSTIKTLPQMSHYLLLKWIARHNDGKSSEYGFPSVVTKFNIADPEDFLKYVVKTQRKQPAAFSMTDGLENLLKLK